jgi:ribonucleoside-diphosphate reductase alpha chain
MEGRYVPSLLAAIGGVIERHMIDIGFLRRADDQEAAADASDPAAAPERAARRARRPAQCPRCGEAALVFQEGCASCAACGYSNCG